MKEVQADTGKGKGKAKERENSQAEDSSLKWTWGPVLTEDEVRKLPESRSLLFPPKVDSGYNVSTMDLTSGEFQWSFHQFIGLI